jgi:hypothetical protein
LLWAGLVVACRGKREGADSTLAPLADFSKRVDEYAALHNRLAANMGPVDETKSQAEIAARAATLGHLIVNARPNAKQGDLFTPEVATFFTTVIRQESAHRPDSVQETREDQEEEHRTDGLPDFTPKVNMLYPTTYPLATFPPGLLPLLPKLPPELEYRIVMHHLVLRDIEANLIVDYIPNAVP